MSKPSKSPENGADLPFEEALKRLESIVEAMESGEGSLEELLQRFDEGSRLVRQCQKKLSEAELRIEELEKAMGEGADTGGDPGTGPR
jgi:exodeoxyribonuclease VII small subunit